MPESFLQIFVNSVKQKIDHANLADSRPAFLPQSWWQGRSNFGQDRFCQCPKSLAAWPFPHQSGDATHLGRNAGRKNLAQAQKIKANPANRLKVAAQAE